MSWQIPSATGRSDPNPNPNILYNVFFKRKTTENLKYAKCSDHFSRPCIITQSDIKAVYCDMKLECFFGFFLIYSLCFMLQINNIMPLMIQFD